MSGLGGSDLRRTRLASDGDDARSGGLTRAVASTHGILIVHHVVHHLLHRSKRALGADLGDEHFRLVDAQLLAVLEDALDEHRTHESAVVGDGVEEGQRIDRRDLHLVAERHPRQRHARPLRIARLTDLGVTGTSDVEIQVGVDARAVETVDELTRIVAVALEDDLGDAHVRGVPDALRYGDRAVASALGVVVADSAAVEFVGAVTHIDGRFGGTDPVLKGHHHGGDLERRARL